MRTRATRAFELLKVKINARAHRNRLSKVAPCIQAAWRGYICRKMQLPWIVRQIKVRLDELLLSMLSMLEPPSLPHPSSKLSKLQLFRFLQSYGIRPHAYIAFHLLLLLLVCVCAHACCIALHACVWGGGVWGRGGGWFIRCPSVSPPPHYCFFVVRIRTPGMRRPRRS